MTGDTSLGETLSNLARIDPRAPAVTCGADTLTRHELDVRTNQLARAYAQLGVTRDALVSIALPNGIEFYEAAIATWKLGATPQPLSWRLPARERDAILDLARPSLILGVEASEAVGYHCIPAGFTPDATLSTDPLPPAAASCWKAPTSGGSTGRPKLIVSTQPATTESVEPFARLIGMRDGDTTLVTGPLYHNAPFLVSACTLVLGGHVVVMPRFDAAEALSLVATHGVSWMYAVPTMLSRIWRLPEGERRRHDLSSLRVVMHMAAPCPPWLKHAWLEWLGPERIWELYAATEVQAVTITTGDEWLQRPGTVGRPVVGEIRILDDDGRPVPSGTVGEIWMRRGEGVPNPYRYVGASARARDGGWESVGDLGRLDEDGYLYLSDRRADLILVGGANVYPAEVEAALTEHPDVCSAVVIGVPHEDLGQVPHALIEVERDVADDDLVAHLADRLATYKLPRTFERVNGPLRDDAGKTRRSALAAERGATATP